MTGGLRKKMDWQFLKLPKTLIIRTSPGFKANLFSNQMENIPSGHWYWFQCYATDI